MSKDLEKGDLARQHEVERENALFQHRLEVKKLILEKVLLGAVVALLGLAVNLLFEKYKVVLTQETSRTKFFEEKRYAAIDEIEAAVFKRCECVKSFLTVVSKVIPGNLITSRNCAELASK